MFTKEELKLIYAALLEAYSNNTSRILMLNRALDDSRKYAVDEVINDLQIRLYYCEKASRANNALLHKIFKMMKGEKENDKKENETSCR